ncbi:hypothetical protein HCH_03758 [Hahella chejuensis KCTC 2396]|uniref:Uncharacterized protein n=1 Tax=Hahella chejuensis (strain KCTC 2396) TaxID=349521 RepID=Q2SFT4_HAHCH|nr:hypothetical protein HCH_03758 [Hahella chejuensis KCTC 2396]
MRADGFGRPGVVGSLRTLTAPSIWASLLYEKGYHFGLGASAEFCEPEFFVIILSRRRHFWPLKTSGAALSAYRTYF